MQPGIHGPFGIERSAPAKAEPAEAKPAGAHELEMVEYPKEHRRDSHAIESVIARRGRRSTCSALSCAWWIEAFGLSLILFARFHSSGTAL